jgi:hypothetical protein
LAKVLTTIIGSDFADNGTTRDGGGIALLFTGLPSVNNSCITGNDRVNTSGLPLSSNGLFAGQGTTDATDNWWGVSDGPSGPGLSGSGDFVYGNNVSVNPFQTASIPCGPQPPICPAGGTQSLSTNSTCVTPTPTPTNTPTPTATSTSTPTPTCDVTANLDQNIRSGPSTSTSIIGRLFSGQEITISGATTAGWYQFFIEDTEHWVLDVNVTPTVPGACNSLLAPLTTPPIMQNTGFYCVFVLMPANFLTYCENTVYGSLKPVYDGLVTRLGAEPTIEEVIAVTIQTDWWNFRNERGGLVGDYGTEGIGRALYEFCGTDDCNIVERLWFLSGYQPWLTGNAGVTAAVDELEDAYDLITPQLSNPTSEYSQVIDDIVTPVDVAWEMGKIANEPWQWFNRDTSATRPTEGTDPCTQVLLRVSLITFEMYTGAQNDNINQSVC